MRESASVERAVGGDSGELTKVETSTNRRGGHDACEDLQLNSAYQLSARRPFPPQVCRKYPCTSGSSADSSNGMSWHLDITHHELGVLLGLALERLLAGGQPTGGGGESSAGNEGSHCNRGTGCLFRGGGLVVSRRRARR